MKTSYFAKAMRYKSIPTEQFISIASSSPSNFHGLQCKKLAPPWPLVQSFKRSGDTKQYVRTYKSMVLADLDPKEIFDELGEDAILLCWEGAQRFCHRHIVARWLEEALHIEIPEL